MSLKHPTNAPGFNDLTNQGTATVACVPWHNHDVDHGNVAFGFEATGSTNLVACKRRVFLDDVLLPPVHA